MVKTGFINDDINSIKSKAKWLVGTIGLFMVFVSPYSFAQTCCSGGVPLGGSLGLGAAESRSLQILLTYDYNKLNDLVNVSEKLQEQTRTRTTQSAIMELNYGLSNRFSLAGVVPYIRQTRAIQTYNGSTDFTAVNGLGDVVLLFKYRILDPLKYRSTSWVLGAGPKIPTGRTNFTNQQGLALAADMQPGSGSWDGILWSYAQQDGIVWPNFGLSSVITYRHSGTNNNYNETQSYRFGNEFQFNLGLNYDFFTGWPMTVFLYTRYRHQSADYVDGNVFPQSGGQWLYSIPGIHIPFISNGSLRLSATLPVYRKLTGTQLTTSYQLKAAVSITLPAKINVESLHKPIKP